MSAASPLPSTNGHHHPNGSTVSSLPPSPPPSSVTPATPAGPSRITLRIPSSAIKPEHEHGSAGTPAAANDEIEAAVEPVEEVEDLEEVEEAEVGVDINAKRLAEARARYEADMLRHNYEPPKVDNPRDDWQVAYVWAFIVKFGLVDRIRRLECLEDFERCLTAPIAERPDDVLENVLIRFVSNLKPGLRDVNCTNVQTHLSNYINEQLVSTSAFTVWDRPWAPNEDTRSGCCNTNPDRTELGRLRYPGEGMQERGAKNPIKQVEQRGGGLFEMGWRDRAKLLRQLVDWQLEHSDAIRAVITREYKLLEKSKKGKTEKEKDVKPKDKAQAVTQPAEAENMLDVQPLGLDRNKNRIWSLDSSARLYRSGNPFKRPCPLVTICSTRAELEFLRTQYFDYGAQELPQLAPSGKGLPKPSKAETLARRKLIKGIEDERDLAKAIDEIVIPRVEKEEQRVQRQKKKSLDALKFAQQAELRATRTRRATRKVDYTYDGFDDDEDEDERRTRKRDNSYADAARGSGRPSIPGERRSARVGAKAAVEEAAYDDGDDDALSSISDGEGNGAPGPSITSTGAGAAGTAGREGSDQVQVATGDKVPVVKAKKERGMKGYAWVVEDEASSDSVDPEPELQPEPVGMANGGSVESAGEEGVGVESAGDVNGSDDMDMDDD